MWTRRGRGLDILPLHEMQTSRHRSNEDLHDGCMRRLSLPTVRVLMRLQRCISAACLATERCARTLKPPPPTHPMPFVPHHRTLHRPRHRHTPPHIMRRGGSVANNRITGHCVYPSSPLTTALAIQMFGLRLLTHVSLLRSSVLVAVAGEQRHGQAYTIRSWCLLQHMYGRLIECISWARLHHPCT